MVKSKFRWLAFVPVLITAAITSGLVGLVYISFDPAVASVLPIFLIAILMAIFVLLWLIRGEARTKIIVAELNFDNLVIRRYYGLSGPVTFYYPTLADLLFPFFRRLIRHTNTFILSKATRI